MKMLRTIKAKVIVAGVLLVTSTIGLLTVALYVQSKRELEELLAQEESAAASRLAAEFDNELIVRADALERIARSIPVGVVRDPIRLQQTLTERPALEALFPQGISIVGAEGDTLADSPIDAGRRGTNVVGRDWFEKVKRTGKAVIGEPYQGGATKRPLFVIAAPIGNDPGFHGALAATIYLDRGNFFLDSFKADAMGTNATRNLYVISKKSRVFVASRDPHRIMKPLSPPGTNRMVDRYLAGYEGYGIAVGSRGTEELSAAKGMTTVPWFVVVSTATSIEFKPVANYLRQALLWVVALSGISALALWGLVFRFLRPVEQASTAIAECLARPQLETAPIPAPADANDEIGVLLRGFAQLQFRLVATHERMDHLLAEQNAILENDLVGIVTVRDRTVVWANRAFEKMLGYGPGELAGTPTRRNYPSEEAYRALGAAAYPVLSAGNIYRAQIKHVRKDGEHIWVDLSGATLDPVMGKSLWAFIDITARRRLEQRLAESEQRMDLALAGADLGLWDLDIATGRFNHNTRLIAMLGYAPDELEVTAKTFRSLLHPDDAARLTSAFHAHLKGETPKFEAEYRVRRKDDRWAWVLSRGKVVERNPEGRAVRILGTSLGITRRKFDEQEIIEGERRLRGLIDATSESVLLLKPDGTVLTINSVAAERFGLTPQELIGRDFFDFMPQELADSRRTQVQGVVATGEVTRSFDRRGQIRFETGLFPVKDETGAVESIAVYAKDVTEQWRAAEIEAMFHRLDVMMLRWSVNTDTIAQSFCDEILPLFNLAAAWIARAETDGTLTLIAAAERDPVSGFVEQLQNSCIGELGRSMACAPAADVVGHGQLRKVTFDSSDCAACRAVSEATGTAAALLLPLTLDGKSWGVLAYCSQQRAFFDQIELLPRLAAISGRIATSLEACVQQEWLTLLDTALETTESAAFITDKAGRILWVNRAMVELTGYARDEMLGATPKIFSSGAQDAEFYARFWQTIQAGTTWRGEIVNARRDGSRYAVNQVVTPLLNDIGIHHYVSIVEDITERKETVARIEHMATFDALTDLPNRVLFFDRLGQAVALARRTGQAGALLFLDLDRFKQVNDKLGHEAGDLLLKDVARRFREQVRESDTVARLGGDEFSMLMPQVEHLQDAVHIAEKIVAAISRPFDLHGRMESIGVSIGIALYPTHGDDPSALLNAADQAMYRAKQAGRNTYRVAEP